MWVVVSPRNSFQLSCRHQFTGQHIGSALDALSAVVGKLHFLLVKLNAVTKDAEHGTSSHDVGVESLFLQCIVLRQSCLIHQIHGFLHRVFDVLVIGCQCKEVVMEHLDMTLCFHIQCLIHRRTLHQNWHVAIQHIDFVLCIHHHILRRPDAADAYQHTPNQKQATDDSHQLHLIL